MYKSNIEESQMNLDFNYARKSKEDKTSQIASIPDQLDIVSNKLNPQFNARVTKENIFTDEKTGMKPYKRDNFKIMMEKIFDHVDSGGTCRILCWKLCRLARNSTEGGVIVDLVRDGKLKIITCFGIFDETNFFMLQIEFGTNSKFSKDISIGVKRNNEYKIRSQIYPGRSHLGYMFNPDLPKGLKDHIPNPKNFDKCRQWIKIMLTGQYTVESSLMLMTAKGLVANDGKPVSKTMAYSFFRDIFNTGLFEIKTGPEKGIHKGKHKPLMKMKEYKKIQRLLDSRGGNKKNWDNPLPFQGILKCGYCGATMTGEKHLKKYKNGKEQWFFYYRCSKKLGPCPEKYLNAKLMDDQIKSYIDEMYIAQEYLDLLKKVLKRQNKVEFQKVAKDRELQAKQLKAIDDEKEALYGMKADGFYENNDEEYQKKKADILQREVLIKEDIMIDKTAYWSDLLEQSMTFISRVKKLFDSDDVFIKQQILKILGSNLSLKDQKVKIEAKNTFIALKRVQQEIDDKMGWLEPTKGLPQQAKDDVSRLSLLSSTAYGSRTRDLQNENLLSWTTRRTRLTDSKF